MENSIEEDVKSINKGLYELEDSYELHQARWAKRIFENIKEKLEHILSDYKRVLKENEYMHNELDKQQTTINKYAKKNEELKKSKVTYEKVRDIQEKNKNIVDKNYISKQKVKDKIEELKNKPLKINQNDKYYYETDAYNKIVIQVLQELLEGRK